MRINEIMYLSFAKDLKILEDKFEKAYVSDKEIELKEIELKGILKEMVLVEEIAKKWNTILNSQTTNVNQNYPSNDSPID